MTHSFHIPVLGLAFSIDSPIKVARFGISSVISIVDDELIERMRAYYADINKFDYQMITKKEDDHRAKRICSYLNLVSAIVKKQIEALRTEVFETGSTIDRYFQLIPETHPAKGIYQDMLLEVDPIQRAKKKEVLRTYIQPGDIDVNIMSKVDKININSQGQVLGDKYTDALAALRGFANSELDSSVVLSAGMNPRLYAYLAELPAFFPTADGILRKKITLKVSDYRSACIQAKFLAKKGIWVSEFRVESGLNCGGHAFATDGFLMGPILEEFKNKKTNLKKELFDLYQNFWSQKQLFIHQIPNTRYTVQGGVGTAEEHNFLIQHYEFDAVGWGSPFLLVPEATTVDEQTLKTITEADASDFYSSDASPLGIPFNNFRNSSAERLRMQRIDQGRPGSPCKKKYLVSNIEFGTTAICTASRKYQQAKLQELDAQELNPIAYRKAFDAITAKSCLCEGLAAPAYIKYGLLKSREADAVAICPGPNTVWFKDKFSLDQMINHIYGREDIIQNKLRPHVFINELHLYLRHIQQYVEMNADAVSEKKVKYLEKFKWQMREGIAYYQQLKTDLKHCSQQVLEAFPEQLSWAEKELSKIHFKINPLI